MAPLSPRLTELVEELADTPTLSAYVSTENARRRGGTHGVWQVDVHDFVERIRREHAPALDRWAREGLERNLKRLEIRLRGLPNAMRAPAWLIIIARGDVHYCAPTARPAGAQSSARWQRGPWLGAAFAPRAANASHDSPSMLTPAEL